MQGDIVFASETATAAYLIPCSGPPESVVDDLRSRLAEEDTHSMGGLALALLDRGVLTVELRDVADIPTYAPDKLGYFGNPSDLVAHVAAQPEGLLVLCRQFCSWPPRHEWAATRVASELSMLIDQPIVDLLLRRITDPMRLAEAIDGGRTFRLGKWLSVLVSSGSEGLLATTLGLGRVGVPELRIQNVPPSLFDSVAPYLTGLGRAALSAVIEGAIGDEGIPAARAMPEVVEVTDADIAFSYGADVEPRRTTRVRLRVDVDGPGGPTFLTVVPPDEWGASHGEWLARSFHELLVDEPEVELRYAHPSELREAVARAVSLLPRARELFAELPADRQLIVKHAVGPDLAEHVWTAVTDWSDPDRIRAVCLDDAASDPTVRTGRPIVIDRAAVTDWMIRGGGQSMGGWTNAVLTGVEVVEPPGV